MIKELKIPKNKFEFQMLLGVKEDLRDKINKDGIPPKNICTIRKRLVCLFHSRLKENPAIAGHIVKAMFSFK